MSCSGIPNSNFWRLSNVWRPSHAWRQRTIFGCPSPKLPWLLLMRPIINSTLFGSFHVFQGSIPLQESTEFASLPRSQESNLRDYLSNMSSKVRPGWQVADLCQLVRTGRARTDTVDNHLMTITTNSTRCTPRYMSKQNVFNKVFLMKCL